MPEIKEIIVIGSGIIGVNIALQLLRRGQKVTLIEKNEPSMGSPYGPAGHIATEAIFPMPSPFLLPQIPAMLLNPNGPLVVKASFMLRFIPWAFKFLLKCRKRSFSQGTEALKFLNKNALENWKKISKTRILKNISSTKEQ
jgi:D-amino-acid dehydrogenase